MKSLILKIKNNITVKRTLGILLSILVFPLLFGLITLGIEIGIENTSGILNAFWGGFVTGLVLDGMILWVFLMIEVIAWLLQ